MTSSEKKCDYSPFSYEVGDGYVTSRQGWCYLCLCTNKSKNNVEFIWINHTSCLNFLCDQNADFLERQCCKNLDCKLKYSLPDFHPPGVSPMNLSKNTIGPTLSHPKSHSANIHSNPPNINVKTKTHN